MRCFFYEIIEILIVKVAEFGNPSKKTKTKQKKKKKKKKEKHTH